jgi:NAD dependent epimerase/dehydratase family enzyme
MQTVLITGGTGMIGTQLTKHLSGKGYKIIILTRKMPVATPPDPNISYALWNVEKQTIDINAVQKADFIIHLAGAGVMEKRWTAAYKATIIKAAQKAVH